MPEEVLDVSKHQGVIDWGRVSQSISSAIIRSGTGTVADARYYANWVDSHNAQIPWRGIYHYYVTEIAPLSQLDAVRRITQDDFGNLPFTIDCERREDEKLQPFDKAAYTRNITKFLDEYLRRYTHPIRIYTSKNEWENMTLPTIGDMSKFGLHVADYRAIPAPAIPRGWTDWKLWQYTSKAKVPGIDTNVDMSRPKQTDSEYNTTAIRWHSNAILELADTLGE